MQYDSHRHVLPFVVHCFHNVYFDEKHRIKRCPSMSADVTVTMTNNNNGCHGYEGLYPN